MLEFAERHGIATIYEGSNYDDLSQYRPGMKRVVVNWGSAVLCWSMDLPKKKFANGRRS